MPRIFDNIDNTLLPELSKVLSVSERADFCAGYFNLRRWRKIDEHIESWSGQNGNACRILVGMHKSPEKGLREKLATAFHDDGIDNARAMELKLSEDRQNPGRDRPDHAGNRTAALIATFARETMGRTRRFRG